MLLEISCPIFSRRIIVARALNSHLRHWGWMPTSEYSINSGMQLLSSRWSLLHAKQCYKIIRCSWSFIFGSFLPCSSCKHGQFHQLEGPWSCPIVVDRRYWNSGSRSWPIYVALLCQTSIAQLVSRSHRMFYPFTGFANTIFYQILFPKLWKPCWVVHRLSGIW